MDERERWWFKRGSEEEMNGICDLNRVFFLCSRRKNRRVWQREREKTGYNGIETEKQELQSNFVPFM